MRNGLKLTRRGASGESRSLQVPDTQPKLQKIGTRWDEDGFTGQLHFPKD